MKSKQEISSRYGALKLSSAAIWQEVAEWMTYCVREKKILKGGTVAMSEKSYVIIKKFVHQPMPGTPFQMTTVCSSHNSADLMLYMNST